VFEVRTVVPHHKKPGPDKQDPYNYQSITNLYTFSNVLK